MAAFSANKPNKTVTIHKDMCRLLKTYSQNECICKETGNQGNQQWWCEKHVSADKIDEFMNGRHWAMINCDVCFGPNE